MKKEIILVAVPEGCDLVEVEVPSDLMHMFKYIKITPKTQLDHGIKYNKVQIDEFVELIQNLENN